MKEKKLYFRRFLKFIGFIIFIFIESFFISKAYAQVSPSYSFISFDASYQTIMNRAKGEGYQIKEEEINSVYGKYHLSLEKSQEFYAENIFIFFDQNRAPIFFTVRFRLKENQPKSILERLENSISSRLTQKYGESSSENLPYFRIIGENYEIMIKPLQAATMYADVTFKHLERFSAFGLYYEQEIKKLETEIITKTVNNF